MWAVTGSPADGYPALRVLDVPDLGAALSKTFDPSGFYAVQATTVRGS